MVSEDCPKPAADGAAGLRQVHAIKNVEHLYPELSVKPFLNRNVLEKCQVDVAVSRSAQRVASNRSEAALRRIHKSIRIDPLHRLALHLQCGHAGIRIST